jgi:NADH:ubiquinone oxidoreductase subunit 5 (subunit L)/multisubunit Na+/H+ antiporter MnhA subunit
VRKYGFDELYQFLFAGGAKELGGALWRYGDQVLIDGLVVNGSARAVGWFAGVARRTERFSLRLRLRHDHRPAGAHVAGTFLLRLMGSPDNIVMTN